ncbi:MAG: hypothetical protein WCL00_12100 [Bacteroidota bacterium]
MKNKVPFMIVTFVVGILFGCLIFWFCSSGCQGKSCKTEHCKICQLESMPVQPTHIDTTKAQAYYHLYHSNPDSIGVLKGFTINLEQFRAMCMILQNDTTGSVHGFRIYMGADSILTNKVLIVVGSGSPDKSGDIYSTSAAGAGPCPIVCDSDSPITRD